MPDTTFDTLEASRRLQAAGFQAEQADAIVDVMNRSTVQLVTVERFEAAVAALDAKIDSVRTELLARIDALRIELREEFMRAQMLFVGIVIAANALMLTILGLLLSRGAI